MDSAREKLEELLSSLQGQPTDSRATSPGGGPRVVEDDDSSKVSRGRPRTYPYFEHLPYKVEEEAERQRNLEEITKQLYIALESADYSPGALHWTRELKGWLGLKFDLTRDQRSKLAKLYYGLALNPVIDASAAERFASMFMLLTKRKHYLRPGRDLTLDWRPIFRELKLFVLPSDPGIISQSGNLKRNLRSLTKLCGFAQLYFDPRETSEILEEFLPYFNTSFSESAYVVLGLMNLVLPTLPAPADRKYILPQHYIPTYFHLWSLMNRSKVTDTTLIDILSRTARDCLPAAHVPFSEFGIFTQEQSATIFTAILRLLEIPVGQATSPYSSVDTAAGLGVVLERDHKKHPVAHHIARWIVMSLGPACLEAPESILSNLEGLIQAVETFYHPSNSGGWTKPLSQLVFYLADFFVMRWNRERSGEMDVPQDRRLNDEVKRRFVLCLREVIFMGIYAKSGTAMAFSLATLQYLAYLEPSLILPGALQRIYPAMQGLVEVHRTTSSLKTLYVLSRTMSRTKGFRCHITTMLGLALPGIDANDLDKTINALSYLQSVCYNIPFHDLAKDKEEIGGNMLALEWITSEVGRMEQEGTDVELDYANGLSDKDEEMILRSSTASLAEFLSSFLGRVFTLLENLPDAARLRTGSPEENVVNTLPATFTPLLASLSPDLYDLALNKIAEFVSNHVIHQARDAMAFICSALCKVSPQKALKRLIPMLIASIRTEIDDYNAASTRNAGAEVLPRDRGLVWSVSMLSMCVVHVGDAVLNHKQELFDVAIYMQQKCIGTPTVHISNFIHHLLLNLTATYPIDYSLYEEGVLARGLGPEDWGRAPDSKAINIKWHVPNKKEIEFAVELLRNQGDGALRALKSLIDGSSPIKRDGTGKAWSDEVSRNLTLLRLLLSGVSSLFDRKTAAQSSDQVPDDDIQMDESEELAKDPTMVDEYETEEKPTFSYPAGYLLDQDDPLYSEVHSIRIDTGKLLHEIHQFLVREQEDDVACFGPLYTAYKSYFIDVGIEKSAHVLDRVTRLLRADIHPYKISGLRKDYPRPLLLRRANVYHIERLRYNAAPRPSTPLDRLLLLDLAQSSVSLYTEVRRNAQSVGESAIKAVFGARPLVIPPLLEALETAIKQNDNPRIKGGLYALLFGSLAKTIDRDWRFTPRVMKAFIAASGADKPSIQKLCGTATFTLMEFCKASRAIALSEGTTQEIAPTSREVLESTEKIIKKRRQIILKKREKIEVKKAALADELAQLCRGIHWKQASRTAAIAIPLGIRFGHIASHQLIDLLTNGAIDSHPGLRTLYAGAMFAVFSLLESRVVAQHSFENYMFNRHYIPAKIQVPTRSDDPNWTQEYLDSFAQPETAYYIDHDYPGWLVWTKTMSAYKSNCTEVTGYDDVERGVLEHFGKRMDKQWFLSFFAFLKQEPRDASADRFRVASVMLLAAAFKMIHDGFSSLTFDDIKAMVKDIYGDGSDKHQHRATAEIFGGLLGSTIDKKIEARTLMWEMCFPTILKVFSDGLTPENFTYWQSFLHFSLQYRDPRRSWPLVEWLSTLKLDLSTNAAFKESTKISLLSLVITNAGWHFRLEKPIVEDFLDHLDHPYKGVREAMGSTLATIYRTRYHESYSSVSALIDAQNTTSSVGVRPYEPSSDFAATMERVFTQLEVWRKERPAGQQTPSSYTNASKTLLLCLDTLLNLHECTQLVPFFPKYFVEQLLHMMDVKEDTELQSLAYTVFRHIPNIPHHKGEDKALIDTLIRIGTNSPFWHQRLRILINIQVIYFRRLFLTTTETQKQLFDCVADMLNDSQLEVRQGAMTTLSGMIRCSPVGLRDQVVDKLSKKFTKQLLDNPLPRKKNARNHLNSSATSTGTSTPIPEHAALIIKRHAAVLGLGALVQAFPYASPPPRWIPGVLATLAGKANADPGMVGMSVKAVLADFKKTRQDTWFVDLNVGRFLKSIVFQHIFWWAKLTMSITGLFTGAGRRSGGRSVEELLCLSFAQRSKLSYLLASA